MMRQNRTLGQMLVREFGAAFGVLALIFLSFAHQPVYAQTPAGSVLDGTFYVSVDFCGDGPGGSDPAIGFSCEACRIAAGIDLPPAPVEAFDSIKREAVLGQVYIKIDRTSPVCAATVHPRAPPVMI